MFQFKDKPPPDLKFRTVSLSQTGTGDILSADNYMENKDTLEI